MQAIEVKGFLTNYRGWLALCLGLLVIVAVWIATTQLDAIDSDNAGAAVTTGDPPAARTLDRVDWLAQQRAAAPTGLDTETAAGDRADTIESLRGEVSVASTRAMTDRADTIQQLRAQVQQHSTPRMDRADTIEALRQTPER